jgi:hypothetical protein
MNLSWQHDMKASPNSTVHYRNSICTITAVQTTLTYIIETTFLEWGWGQECQRLPNFGLGLQLVRRRRLSGLQKTLGLVPRPTRSLRRRASLSLYDMQKFK